MARYKNFTVDVDGDGRHCARHLEYARPFDERVLGRRDDRTRRRSSTSRRPEDAAVKGVVVTSGKEALSPVAPTSPCSKAWATPIKKLLKEQGRGSCEQVLFEQSSALSQHLSQAKPPASRGSRPSTALAMGGAFELALACHYRVAATIRRLRLGLPEVKVGLFPGAGGTQRVPRIVPTQDALQMLLQGRSAQSDKASR
jgi:3-hydroxyacyl-CoA dehydrogenase/enoyl-CoA hydratase/3-hydroxybutyryl-CoA epimerase